MHDAHHVQEHLHADVREDDHYGLFQVAQVTLSGGEQKIHGPQAEDGEHVAGIDEEGVVRDGDDGRDRVEREHHVGHFHHKQAQEQRRGLPDQLAGSIGGLHEEIVAAELVVHGDEALGVPDGPVLGVVAVALELILLDLVHVVAVLFGDGRVVVRIEVAAGASE